MALNCFVSSGSHSRDRHNEPDDEDDDFYNDREMDADEMRDFEDQDPHRPLTSSANLGPYASFLQNLPDLINMTQEEYNKAFQALPLPTPGPSPPHIDSCSH